MLSKKQLFFLLISALSLAQVNAVQPSFGQMKMGAGAMCGSPQSCRNNKGCHCYCSRKCGPRQKEAGDAPVWIENDPNGHYCYCKQWDLDNYNKRCK